MAGHNVLELTDQNFAQEVLQSDVPVLVDFWAKWCMPCKMLAPTVDELANDFAGRAKVGKVDTDSDSNRDISVQFGISAIPTIIIFSGGQMVKKFVGLQSKADLTAALNELLG
jgi:thioredoxin 1